MSEVNFSGVASCVRETARGRGSDQQGYALANEHVGASARCSLPEGLVRAQAGGREGMQRVQVSVKLRAAVAVINKGPCCKGPCWAGLQVAGSVASARWLDELEARANSSRKCRSRAREFCT